MLDHYDANEGVHDAAQVPWYDTLNGNPVAAGGALKGALSLSGFRMTGLGRKLTHSLVTALEILRIAPKVCARRHSAGGGRCRRARRRTCCVRASVVVVTALLSRPPDLAASSLNAGGRVGRARASGAVSAAARRARAIAAGHARFESLTPTAPRTARRPTNAAAGDRARLGDAQRDRARPRRGRPARDLHAVLLLRRQKEVGSRTPPPAATALRAARATWSAARARTSARAGAERPWHLLSARRE